MHLFLFFAYLFASGQERGDLSGSSIAKPANPVREGYTFEGWFTDSEGKNAFNFETAKPETDTVIYTKTSLRLAGGRFFLNHKILGLTTLVTN